MTYTCVKCKERVKEVCPDGYCRKCHVSLSFEDCCDGTWSAKINLRSGMPYDYVKKLYPEAKI